MSHYGNFHLQEAHWEFHRLDCGRTQNYLYNTAKYLRESLIIPDASILQTVSTYDAAETLNLDGRWPRTYTCDFECCPKCQKRLPPIVKKRQKNRNDRQILVTKLHIIVIDILSKRCKDCSLHISLDTTKYGLLNIGDLALISLDIFFTVRNTVR